MFIPDTNYVRAAYVRGTPNSTILPVDRGKEFDAWLLDLLLKAVEAQVEKDNKALPDFKQVSPEAEI